MRNKSEILRFMNKQQLMVLSTAGSAGALESAVVGFGQTDDCQLIFGTSARSRKAHNLQANPRIAAVIGWDIAGTLQYEGTARLLAGDEALRYSEMYFTKTPSSRKYQEDPDEIFFLVTPAWMRFSEEVSGEWLTTEITF
jgi:pyridoxine/pyridoxamine 5'-phosphate oxidase